MRKTNFPGAEPAGQPASPPPGNAAGVGPDAEALFQQLPWGVVVLEAPGTVLRLNQQAADWWGCSLPDLQGKPLAALPAGTLPTELWQALQRVTSSPEPLPGEFFLPQRQQWLAMTSARQGDNWVVYWQDITAQKQLEDQSQARQAASDALRRRTEAVARTGSYELELATGHFHYSDGLCRLFGEEPGAFVPDMAFIDARSHPGDVALVRQVLAQAIESRQAYHYQRRIYRPDGQLRTLEAHGQVECDALGQPVKLLGLLQDVTEREQAAQELLQAKDELARRATDSYVALYNSMDEGFCTVEVLFDAQGQATDYRFLEANPAFGRQTGLADVVGRTMRELTPAHEDFWFEAYGRVARTGEARRFEHEAAALGSFYDVYAFRIGDPAEQRVAILFNDITARKHAEAALRRSEEQLRLFVTASSDVLYRMDAGWQHVLHLDGRSVLADTAAASTSWLAAYIPPAEQPAVHAAIQAAIAGPHFFALEHRVYQADGTVGWTFSRAVPVLDGRGALLEWFGTATDITARKQAEEALRQSEERLRRMMNVPHVGILTFSLAGALLTANDAFLDLLGYGRAEFEACTFTWQDFTPPEYTAESQRQLARVQQTGLGGPYQKEYLRRDGSRQWLMFVAAALGDGTLVKYVIDVSAQKQAEADLRASEQRQRVLIENLPGAAVFVVDRELRYQLAAGEALRPAGFEPADFRGRTVRDVAPPAHWPAFRDMFRQALAGRAFEHEHEQGGRTYVSRGVPLPGPTGQIDAVLAVSYDITDRKAAEEALRASEAKYRTLFETMDQGFGVGEVLPAGPGRPADFRWLEVNPQVERLTSMSQAALLSGDTMRTMIPQLEDVWYERYERVALTGEPVRFEEHAQMLGRWFDVYAYALDPDGPAPHRVALLFTNITVRKQAEEALRHAEERHREQLEQQVAARTGELRESRHLLQTVFDASPTAIVVMRLLHDAAGRAEDFEILIFNEFNKQVTGRDDLVGQRFTAMFPQTVPTGTLARLLAVATTGKPADFEQWYEGEGMQHWFRHIVVRQDGLLVLTSEVITARKQLEQGQAQSLALLQQSEAVAVMGSWEYDLGTREFIWSEGLYRLFEMPLGSAIELQGFLDGVFDDDRPAAAQLVRTLTAGTAGFDTTVRMHVGEAVKTMRFKGMPLPDAPGTPERVLGVCLDVSDVQRLEAENLALKLDRHKELLLAILQAQETERQRLGEVLHNGLGQVLYATKLHLDQLDAPALHALPGLSGLYRQTGRLLADAMRQTRTLAHELVPTSLLNFGLSAAVRDVCRDLSTPGLRISCHVWDEKLPLPQPVQVTLFRLAQELAHNIVRHAGATQASLELETLPGGISLRAEDNGHGFDPLTVAEGLGLRTVRQAVALLGGTVAVDSSPAFGTHIRLRIPLPLFS